MALRPTEKMLATISMLVCYGGCFDPQRKENLGCSEDGLCPSGLVCQADLICGQSSDGQSSDGQSSDGSLVDAVVEPNICTIGDSCSLTGQGDQCYRASNVTTEEMRACDENASDLVVPPGQWMIGRNSLTCIIGICETKSISIDSFTTGASTTSTVVCVSSLEIQAGASVLADSVLDSALIFLVAGDAEVAGSIDFSGAAAENISGISPGGTGGPGGAMGGGGSGSGDTGYPGRGIGGGQGGGRAASKTASGGGGGGFGGGGGGGGGPALGGISYGNPTLEPLMGGSGGGQSGRSAGTPYGGGGGGGAIQITAQGSLQITGSIIANGGAGEDSTQFSYSLGGGGGSGGAILLEAKNISFGTTANLLVNGGNGGSSSSSNPGGLGASGPLIDGGAGTKTEATQSSGGGGGGGRIRINSLDSVNCPAGSSPTSSCTTGSLVVDCRLP